MSTKHLLIIMTPESGSFVVPCPLNKLLPPSPDNQACNLDLICFIIWKVAVMIAFPACICYISEILIQSKNRIQEKCSNEKCFHRVYHHFVDFFFGLALLMSERGFFFF